jgi:hypothetical protein
LCAGVQELQPPREFCGVVRADRTLVRVVKLGGGIGEGTTPERAAALTIASTLGKEKK